MMWHLMRDYVISIIKTSSFASSANTPNSSSSLTIYKSNFMAEPSHYTSYKNNIMRAICFISCLCSMTSHEDLLEDLSDFCDDSLQSLKHKRHKTLIR